MIGIILSAIMLGAVLAIIFRGGAIALQAFSWMAIAWAAYTLYQTASTGGGNGYNWPLALIVLAIAWGMRKWVIR